MVLAPTSVIVPIEARDILFDGAPVETLSNVMFGRMETKAPWTVKDGLVPVSV